MEQVLAGLNSCWRAMKRKAYSTLLCHSHLELCFSLPFCVGPCHCHANNSHTVKLATICGKLFRRLLIYYCTYIYGLQILFAFCCKRQSRWNTFPFEMPQLRHPMLTITCHHLSYADPWNQRYQITTCDFGKSTASARDAMSDGQWSPDTFQYWCWHFIYGFFVPLMWVFVPHCQAEWLNGMPKWLSRGFNGASGACLNQHRRVGLVHAASCYSVLTENYYVLLQDAGSNFSCKEHVCQFLPMKCRTLKCFFHVHACDQVNLPCGW